MRLIDFSDGFTSSAQPIAGVLAVVTGSTASPTNITTAGITPGGYAYEMMFVQGSGGAIDVTANPQIAAGTVVGQLLDLIFCSDTNTLLLEDGTGLSLNGNITGKQYYELALRWDGTVWKERYRREA